MAILPVANWRLWNWSLHLLQGLHLNQLSVIDEPNVASLDGLAERRDVSGSSSPVGSLDHSRDSPA
jgi:hypothetical protein